MGLTVDRSAYYVYICLLFICAPAVDHVLISDVSIAGRYPLVQINV